MGAGVVLLVVVVSVDVVVVGLSPLLEVADAATSLVKVIQPAVEEGQMVGDSTQADVTADSPKVKHGTRVKMRE